MTTATVSSWVHLIVSSVSIWHFAEFGGVCRGRSLMTTATVSSWVHLILSSNLYRKFRTLLQDLFSWHPVITTQHLSWKNCTGFPFQNVLSCLYVFQCYKWFWSCLPLCTAACLHSVLYTTFFFGHSHAGNPTIQMQDSWLLHLLLLWTPHVEFTPTRP